MPNSLTDYETLAAAVLPPETYDFIAGGSGTETTLTTTAQPSTRSP